MNHKLDVDVGVGLIKIGDDEKASSIINGKETRNNFNVEQKLKGDSVVGGNVVMLRWKKTSEIKLMIIIKILINYAKKASAERNEIGMNRGKDYLFAKRCVDKHFSSACVYTAAAAAANA